MPKQYNVQCEIAGPYAMFSRPDSGAGFVSYPAPTWSACKGIFETVARIKSAYIDPVKVEICAPVQYHRYTTNYGGPLRKRSQITDGNAYQFGATVLVNVCYRLYGVARETGESDHPQINACHYIQELFNRRLRRGKYVETPNLGWREFVPTYFGQFRENTQVCTMINEYVPSMLRSPFDTDVNGVSRKDGKNQARFDQGVWIREGVLSYAK